MKVKRQTEIKTDNIKIGDIITVKIKGEGRNEAMAVSETEDAVIFCMVDCMKYPLAMNDTDDTEGGYEKSHMRQVLNDTKDGVLAMFPKKLRKKMVPFENGDYLRLPSEKEIFGRNIYAKSEEKDVEQWEPMKIRRNRVCEYGHNTGDYARWWLRDVVSSANFAYVYAHGNAGNYGASGALGVRPVFGISKSLICAPRGREE